MLTMLVQPVLKCMHFLHTVVAFILAASYHGGRAMLLGLEQVWNIISDTLTVLAIIGEEFYHFLCELISSIYIVCNYIRSSANGGINSVLEAVGLFATNLGKFFLNTRVRSKLLATCIGNFIGNIFNVLRNALLLIRDCAWWLITVIPKWLLWAIISVGDFMVDIITAIRGAIVYTARIIMKDVTGLIIGITFLFVLWHNRRRWTVPIVNFFFKVKNIIILFCRKIFRRRKSDTGSEKIRDPEQSCVICKERQKCVLLLPCKHLCLCNECANDMFGFSENCPLCRTLVDQSVSVFV